MKGTVTIQNKRRLWTLNHTIGIKQTQKITQLQTQINSSGGKKNDSEGEIKDQKQQPRHTKNQEAGLSSNQETASVHPAMFQNCYRLLCASLVSLFEQESVLWLTCAFLISYGTYVGTSYLSLHRQDKSNHSQETIPKEPDLYLDLILMMTYQILS